MQLKTKYGLFTVHFEHRQNEHPRNTTCEVHNGECSSPESANFVVGEFKLYSKSRSFNKRVARKISLANALRSEPREVRTAIWDAYFQIVPKR